MLVIQLKTLLLISLGKIHRCIFPRDIQNLIIWELIMCYKELNDALLFGVKTKRLDWIRYAIDGGADVNHATLKVIKNGHLDILKYLVLRGLDFKESHYQVMGAAVHYGYLDIVKYLVEHHKIDIHSYDDHIFTVAIENDRLDIVKYLIEKGVNIHTESGMAFSICAGRGHLDIVKLLIERGSFIDNEKALVWSAEKNHLKTVEYLLDNGFDIHLNNKYILKSAISDKYVDMVQLLVNRGCPTHLCNDEELAWMIDNNILY